MSKRFFPVGGRQLFDGGLNTKYAPSIIENNESSDCLNVIFSNGAVKTRLGTTQVNTTPVASFPIDGLYTYRNNSGQESMCVFAGGLMYTLGATTFVTVPSAQGVFAQGARVASTLDENYIFFGNGLTTPYKFNGSFTQMGVPKPTVTATVASNGVGALTASGQYQYTYSYVNTNVVEGNVGPVSTTFTISSTSGQNTISNILTAPVSFGVNNKFLYRTKANTTTPFFRIATLTNSTSTFNDNIPDASLVTQAPTDNGTPPNFSVCTYAQNRIFCNDTANPNLVWYSNLNQPYTFSALSFIKIGDNTSDTVRGLSYYNGSVVVFCDYSVYMIYLTDTNPADWAPFKTDSPYGSKSHYSAFQYNNKLGFAAIQNQKFVGIGALNGNTVDTSKVFLTVSTTGTDLKSDVIEPDMYQVQESFLQNITSFVYKKKTWISVTYGTGQTTNNRVYQMDFSMSNVKKDQEFSWCPFTGINAAQFCVYGGQLYYGTTQSTGLVYVCEQTAYNDNGSAINSYFWTKEFVGVEDEMEGQGSDTNVVKDFRWANILMDTSGKFSMNVTYLTDSQIGGGTVVTQSLDPGGSQWGFMVWGTSTWGGGAMQIEPRIYLQNARGKRIKYRFDNQNVTNQNFGVHGLNFAYNLKGNR